MALRRDINHVAHHIAARIALEHDVPAVDLCLRIKPIVDHQQPGAAILAQLQKRIVVEPDSGRGAARQTGATTHTNAIAAILGNGAATDGRLRSIPNGDAIAAVVLDDIVDERGARIAAEGQAIQGVALGEIVGERGASRSDR